jgi:hypothetical protein
MPATVADFTRIGVVVTVWSRTLGAEVHLVPDAEAGAALVETGIPASRVYLPQDLLGLHALFRLDAVHRAEAVRAVDAIRDVFGVDSDVCITRVGPQIGGRPEALDRCRACKGRRWWRFLQGPLVCGICYPPATPDLVADWIEDEAPPPEAM